MRNVLLIIRREFLERVRTRSFVLSTVLFPLFMVAMIVLPSLMRSGGGERTLVLVDQSPAGIGGRVAQALQAPREEKDAIRYTLERVPGPLEPQRARLNARVEAKEIDGYLYIGPDVLATNQVQYRARDVTRVAVLQDVERAVTGVVRQERLRGQGLTAAQVAQLVAEVEVRAARITGEGGEGGNVMATMIAAYVIGIMFMQLILLYGQNAMRSVLEEKNNRIVEVIVSSVHASQLMAGKVLGLAAVAVLQVGIWVGFSALVTSQGARLGVSAGALRAVQLDPTVWAAILVYFILGFVLYAAMYAAAGSTVTSEQEAQQLSVPLMMPLLVPIIFIMPVLTDPLGSTARLLSLIPLTSPVVMPMRAVATEIPPLEIALSIALLVVGVFVVLWLAGKIYRVGILSTGKKPTLRELARWMRAA
ncbi:MAG TPA: ABC transporter permease [Longimicrobium sp.]|nr:ABC transporter permease [Longimicrobium sp.]